MIRKTPGYGATGRSDAGLSRLEVRGGLAGEPLRHGYGLRSLLPDRLATVCTSGLNGAGGAAGEGVTKNLRCSGEPEGWKYA
ncbi:hypothetical protein K8Q80_25315 [Escherichia coli]|uniref:hypothetical protein n=1 Tax=Escherichia coli TaxID=562 RepID=UPI0040678A5E